MRPTVALRKLYGVVTATALAAAVLASVATASAAEQSTAAALPTGRLVPPAGTSLLGALVVKGSKKTEPAAWTKLEAGAGNHVSMAQIIYSWGQTIPTWRESYHLAQGRIPFISWGWVNSTDVTAGKYDTYIRTTAEGIKALGGTVFLRWFWEMDGKALASYAVSPTAYKAAWGHIRSIFMSVGATNVVWVWTPTAYGFTVGRAAQWYPGPSQVDWIGADGFDWYPTETGAPDLSFADVFKAFYQWGLTAKKPMMAAATGAVETADPMGKANWIEGIANTIRTIDPGIRAVCYLDDTSGSYTDPSLVMHWEVDSSVNSMTAWNDIANQPLFANAH
jgi:hypothetical protein